MEQGGVPYQKILFVCINTREPDQVCCARRGSDAIAAALKARIQSLGLSRAVRVSKSGCQDVCAQGPNVMVFPDYRWYRGVTAADVEQIVEETVRGLPPSESASQYLARAAVRAPGGQGLGAPTRAYQAASDTARRRDAGAGRLPPHPRRRPLGLGRSASPGGVARRSRPGTPGTARSWYLARLAARPSAAAGDAGTHS